jgi:hypothetical protein
MKTIDRECAEQLFNKLKLKNSKICQNKNEIEVKLEFVDNRILIMKYNKKKLTKTYLVNEN